MPIRTIDSGTENAIHDINSENLKSAEGTLTTTHPTSTRKKAHRRLAKQNITQRINMDISKGENRKSSMIYTIEHIWSFYT